MRAYDTDESGLRLDLGGGLVGNDYRIGKIRCFETNDFDWNFGPLWPHYPCDTVYNEIIDGVNDYEFISDVEIYPNPVLNLIEIHENVPSFQWYEILNISGVVLDRKRFTKTLNVSNLISGPYWIRLYNDNSNFRTFKFIKS